jgi:hypothetical protein
MLRWSMHACGRAGRSLSFGQSRRAETWAGPRVR